MSDPTDRQELLVKNLDTIYGRHVTGECRVCGNPVGDTRLRKYCSQKCRSLAYQTATELSWQTVRKRVLRRDDRECVRCGADGTDRGVELEVDHVVPLSRGGAALAESNLQTLCRDCHELKGLSTDDWRDADLRPGVDADQTTARERLRAALDQSADQSAGPPAARTRDQERFVSATPVENGLSEPEPPCELPIYEVEPMSRQGKSAAWDINERQGQVGLAVPVKLT
jgi:5-methylcytosine-specific restriction endonuclease McrA